MDIKRFESEYRGTSNGKPFRVSHGCTALVAENHTIYLDGEEVRNVSGLCSVFSNVGMNEITSRLALSIKEKVDYLKGEK